MVAWLPGGYQEVPLGFRLDTSTDGTRWTVAREVPRLLRAALLGGGASDGTRALGTGGGALSGQARALRAG